MLAVSFLTMKYQNMSPKNSKLVSLTISIQYVMLSTRQHFGSVLKLDLLGLIVTPQKLVQVGVTAGIPSRLVGG